MKKWHEPKGQRDARSREGEIAHSRHWVLGSWGLVSVANVSPNILLPCKGRSGVNWFLPFEGLKYI